MMPPPLNKPNFGRLLIKAVAQRDLKDRLLGATLLLGPASYCLWQGAPWLTWMVWLVLLFMGYEWVILVYQGRCWNRPSKMALMGAAFFYLFGVAWLIGTQLIPLWGRLAFQPAPTPPALWYLIVLVIFTDTGAYAAGRLIGGPLLAPSISPKKTWSGLCGGVFSGTVAGVLTYTIAFPQFVMGPSLWIQTAFLTLVSQGGDLLESKAKRLLQVKDSSHLIPGHGGFWDRFDGLVAALAGWSLINLLS